MYPFGQKSVSDETRTCNADQNNMTNVLYWASNFMCGVYVDERAPTQLFKLTSIQLTRSYISLPNAHENIYVNGTTGGGGVATYSWIFSVVNGYF